MSTAFYIVLLSHGQWWVDLEGRSTGPFTSLEIAKSAAVAMAEASARAGRRTEVQVAGLGSGNDLIYRSRAQSALTRATARDAALAAV